MLQYRDWFIDHIPMDKSVLRQFLKAGFVFQGELFPTDAGTPQGGIISPTLADMTLDGLQQVLSNRLDLSRKGNYSAFVHNKGQVNLVRYADDFIVTAAIGEDKEMFYKTPININGRDDVKNMAYVHKYRQQIFLERRAKA